MFNSALYRREMKSIWKMLAIFGAVLTLYVSVIVSMFNPEMQETLNQMMQMMPEMMDTMGFYSEDASMLGFLSSYLYGFILIVFPMVFSMLCGNKLVARHIEKGSMVSLLAAPVKRRTVALTQMSVILSGIIALIVYSTALEYALAQFSFPGELDGGGLLLLSAGLLCLHFFIGGICFFCSCLFSETKFSVGFGAGIPALMFILQMLGNNGGRAENAKYFTFFTLFNHEKLIEGGDTASIAGILVLLAGAGVLFAGAITVFTKRDLHI